MTAAATHANQIDLTFNKTIGSDAKITLTKGTSAVANTSKIAEDGKSAAITLTGKLTAGTYTVTVVAGNDTLTANVETKDEVLTSFALGSTLKEKPGTRTSSTTAAIISYKALNQYGDTLNYQPKDGSVTVSIGKVDDSATKPCKTSGAGTITVTDIPTLYAIAGQSFTFVLVDTQNNTGITLNTTAVYGQAASAKTFEFAGVYNTAKSAFKDIAEDDKIEDYCLMFTAKDQYGDDMDSSEIATAASNGAITVTVAGGLTNLSAASLTDTSKTVKEIGDKKYFAVPLTGAAMTADSTYAKANAGTATITAVNNTQGIVYTGEITVTSGVVIQNVTVNAKDLIYASEDNELEFTVTDTNGNTVTDYATLKGIDLKPTNTSDSIYWKKNADGSAKLIYNPAAVAPGTTGYIADIKNSEVRSLTITANKAISGNLKVYSKTFTVYHAKVAQSVSKVTASTVCVNATEAAIKLSDLVLLDQWYNALDSSSAAAKAATVNVTTASAIANNDDFVTAGGIKGSGVVSTTAIASGSSVTSVAMSSAKNLRVYTTEKLKLNFKVAGSVLPAAQNEGCTVTFTAGDSTKVSGLQVTKVNDGNQYYVNDSLGSSKPVTMSIEVKGLVNGVLTTIPDIQYKIVEANAKGIVNLAALGTFDKEVISPVL